MNPEAASSAKRDATPLRLLSWLQSEDKLIEATMLHLSTVEEVKDDSELLALGRTHLEMDTPFVFGEALRDHLIELISVRNLRHRPEALFALFRQFLQRLWLGYATSWTLYYHNSSQSVPPGRMLLGLYGLATTFVLPHMENGYPYEPRVTIAYFFTSHDHIHHVRVLWGTLPLLLFSDPRMVYPVDVNQFQGQAVHRLASTAYPIRLEERHGSACVLQSPEWTPCERSFPGCPHRTRVCCDSRKEN